MKMIDAGFNLLPDIYDTGLGSMSILGYTCSYVGHSLGYPN